MVECVEKDKCQNNMRYQTGLKRWIDALMGKTELLYKLHVIFPTSAEIYSKKQRRKVQFIFKAAVGYGYTLGITTIKINFTQLRSAMASHIFL
ncbi:uncharacterized protein LOC142319620 isoform X3 [Lycorma delicatula]|uniref:uncharacterized protein LOC142319620 isoform X3 n=1 Tax=Lycorma delicatula TaxID=130591 RepID=UPI003F512695